MKPEYFMWTHSLRTVLLQNTTTEIRSDRCAHALTEISPSITKFVHQQHCMFQPCQTDMASCNRIRGVRSDQEIHLKQFGKSETHMFIYDELSHLISSFTLTCRHYKLQTTIFQVSRETWKPMQVGRSHNSIHFRSNFHAFPFLERNKSRARAICVIVWVNFNS